MIFTHIRSIVGRNGPEHIVRVQRGWWAWSWTVDYVGGNGWPEDNGPPVWLNTETSYQASVKIGDRLSNFIADRKLDE